MYHVIYTLRTYLNFSQTKLAKAAGLTQADVSEIETKPPYGHITKYQRLAAYLGVSVDCLAKNDYRAIPASFFTSHPRPVYMPVPIYPEQFLGRQGEEFILRREQERLKESQPVLAQLVLPFFKMKCPSPGYDILTFDDDGKPYCLEVKTSISDANTFRLTCNELNTAKKMVQAGERYMVAVVSRWNSPDQRVTDLSFHEILTRYRCSPAFYYCVPKPKAGPISGLAYHRQLHQLRQEDMAQLLGIPQSDLSRYETGQRNAPVSLYLQASAVLDTPVDLLLKKYDMPSGEEAG